MAYSLSEGEVFNYTATGAVANGDMLVNGQRVGVALTSATGAGQVIPLGLTGVFDVMCATTGTITAGNAAYYRTATGKKAKACVLGAATGTASGMGRAIGIFWETKTSGATRTTVKVKMTGGPIYWA